MNRCTGIDLVTGLARVDASPERADASRARLADRETLLRHLAQMIDGAASLQRRFALGDETAEEAAENLEEAYVEALEEALPLRACAGTGHQPCSLVGEADASENGD